MVGRDLAAEVFGEVVEGEFKALRTQRHRIHEQHKELFAFSLEFGWVDGHQHVRQVFLQLHHAGKILLSEY